MDVEYPSLVTSLENLTESYKALKTQVNRVGSPSTIFVERYYERFDDIMRGLQCWTLLIRDLAESHTDIQYTILFHMYKNLARKIGIMHCKFGIKLGHPGARDGICEVNRLFQTTTFFQ